MTIRLYIPLWDLWDLSPPRKRTRRECTGRQPTLTSNPPPPGARQPGRRALASTRT
ncbi:hypothetical protein LZ30DRAFT_715402 [Colletotrichum cereale]|nr:hypothetical protein LZ30DRAFT_715402 [Colletotrichum cereale]